MPNEKAELLGFRLRENNMLATVYLYRTREQDFKSYFPQDGDLMYYCNIPGLMQKFGV
jgi:hypothetical protein